MTYPAVTAALAAAFALLTVVLSLQTSMRRMALKVTHGDAGDDTLRRRIRAHGNFIEYAPLAVILVLLVELTGGASPRTTMALAVAMASARILHALGMLYMRGPAIRAAAMLMQHSAFVFAALLLVRRAWPE